MAGILVRSFVWAMLLSACTAQTAPTRTPEAAPPTARTAKARVAPSAPPRAEPVALEKLALNADPEADTRRQIAELREAQRLYRQFIDRAGDRAEYRDAVERSRERIGDIDKTIDFLEGKTP